MAGGDGQPLWLLIIVAALGGGGLVGGLAAAYGTRVTERLGIRSNELRAREDELTGEDRLIGRLEVRVAAETDRADHAVAELVRERAELARERDYVERLRRHIWEGRGWPPPSREERS